MRDCAQVRLVTHRGKAFLRRQFSGGISSGDPLLPGTSALLFSLPLVVHAKQSHLLLLMQLFGQAQQEVEIPKLRSLGSEGKQGIYRKSQTKASGRSSLSCPVRDLSLKSQVRDACIL